MDFTTIHYRNFPEITSLAKKKCYIACNFRMQQNLLQKKKRVVRNILLKTAVLKNIG
jgi:hypothetical protein